MITPPFLSNGDKIGIVAPARKVTEAEINDAVKFLQHQGFEVVLGKNLFGINNQFSGTDNERAADLQQMIDDTEVKAILMARGGYGCMRIVDEADFSPLMENPKWICGYSDTTVFHSHLHTYLGMQTLHSTMAFNFQKEKFDPLAAETFIKGLKGEPLSYEYKTEETISHFNVKGNITAPVVGGNLSMLYACIGSPSDLDTMGKILFIEDLDEYLYHIDRMMQSLKRSGKFDHIAGLIVGGMTDMKDNEIPFGKTAEEIIFEYVKDLEIPVAFGFPAGHVKENCALILGADAEFNVAEDVTLTFLNNPIT